MARYRSPAAGASGRSRMIAASLAVLIAAPPASELPPPMAPPPIIEIRRADGSLVARAMLWQNHASVEVRVQAAGLPAGHYGIHLHAVGRCEGPAFASAGPHWNPTARQHGSLNP